MNLKKCNQLLQEYKNQLNGISTNDNADYKVLLSAAVSNFYYEIKKIDKNFFINYFNNINEENFLKNKVQKDAFNYLFLLILKNTHNAEILGKFFPEYLDSDPIIKSSWRVIRWLQTFIYWLFKPKLKMYALPDATTLLNALRDIKHRIKNNKTNLLDVDLEMEKYKSLTFIVKKFLENKVQSLIYTPIAEDNLLKESDLFCKNQIFILKNYDLNREDSDIDYLLKYLSNRIKSLSKYDIKIKLLKDLTELKTFVFNNEYSLFETKYDEIKKIIDSNFVNENVLKIQGIYNLIEGIKQRFALTTNFNKERNLVDKNINSLKLFKFLLFIRINKIKFYYEKFRENLDKQYDLCYGNKQNVYENLNKLEKILYVDKNLFFNSINSAFYNGEFKNLLITLDKLQRLAKALGEAAKKMDPKTLENDIHKLSQIIFMEISTLQTKFKEERAEISYSCRHVPDEEIEVCEEDEGWDTEWESESDTSEITNVDLTEQEENNEQSFCDYTDLTLPTLSSDVILEERELGDSESESGYSDMSNLSLSLLEREQGNGRSGGSYPVDVANQSSNVNLGSSTSSSFFGEHRANNSCQQPMQDTLSILNHA